MPRYMVERTFPDGLAIPTNEQGRETTAKVAARNAEVGVTWVHSYVTPDRTKTFEAGAPPGSAAAEGSTPGAPPQLGHLRSVVALVWRSVVLWMLLLALLSLANLIG
jgi:hypothetical protein